MRSIKYQQSECLLPWNRRQEQPLHRFILEVPYGLYFTVVPSREALNEVLREGTSGGGQGTGLTWEPFDLSQPEYDELLATWKTFDARDVLLFKKEDIPDLSFVFDEEILAIPHHLEYLKRSREKYEQRFRPPAR